MQGGQFGAGFASAGFGDALAPGLSRAPPVFAVLGEAIVGGTISQLNGGKFANGAASAAFAYAYNQALDRARAIAANGLNRMWRGIIAHKEIELDIKSRLSAYQVDYEYHYDSDGVLLARADVVITEPGTGNMFVFEIKPESHAAIADFKKYEAADLAQLGRYIAQLSAGNPYVSVQPGNWNDFFPNAQYISFTSMPITFAGYDWGPGSYIYGPGPNAGFIYYSAQSGVVPVPHGH
jgi:hypothetical protein